MEKGILFSTPMVQAILDGRKTITRRAIKDRDITNWFDIDVDGTASVVCLKCVANFY